MIHISKSFFFILTVSLLVTLGVYANAFAAQFQCGNGRSIYVDENLLWLSSGTSACRQYDPACKPSIAGRADGCSIPEKVDIGFGKLFNLACNEHDICYSDLDQEKKACDREFLHNMTVICWGIPGAKASVIQLLLGFFPIPPTMEVCEDAAIVFYMAVAVSKQGEQSYENDQTWGKEHCLR